MLCGKAWQYFYSYSEGKKTATKMIAVCIKNNGDQIVGASGDRRPTDNDSEEMSTINKLIPLKI